MNARWEDATTTLKCMDRVRAPIDISKLDGSETIRDAPLGTMTGERVRHLVQCLEHVGEGIFTRCERNSDDAALSFEEMLCPHIPRTPEWERVTKLLARKVMSTTIATMKEASALLSTKEEKCGLCGELLTDPHEPIWQFKGMKVCNVCRDGEKNANVRKEARKCKPTERYNCEHPNFEATRHIVPLMKRLGPWRCCLCLLFALVTCMDAHPAFLKKFFEHPEVRKSPQGHQKTLSGHERTGCRCINCEAARCVRSAGVLRTAEVFSASGEAS
jgi:hypothetical protein